MAALPKNHAIPYPVSNKPKAVLPFCGGIDAGHSFDIRHLDFVIF
jgi:hypothetical protein